MSKIWSIWSTISTGSLGIRLFYQHLVFWQQYFPFSDRESERVIQLCVYSGDTYQRMGYILRVPISLC